MFVVVLTYVKPLDEIDAALDEHVRFLEHQYAAGVFVASGRRVPRTGGVIVASGCDRAALDAILAQDPFQREGLARYEVIEFVASKMRAGFEAFVEPPRTSTARRTRRIPSAALVVLGAAALLSGPPVHAAPHPTSVSASYFGDSIAHPGLRLGTDFALLAHGGNALLVTGSVGGYDHRGSATGLLAAVELGYRYELGIGLQLEARVGAGYLHTLLDGKPFESTGDGQFRQMSLAGAGAFAPSGTIGFGWDFTGYGRPIAAFLRLTTLFQVPTSGATVMHPVIELGASWSFAR